MTDMTREDLVVALDSVEADATLSGGERNDIVAEVVGAIADRLRLDYSMESISNSDIANQNANVIGTRHERPTITLTNDDVLRVLGGLTMDVVDRAGVEYNVRLATADELEADMRAAAEKFNGPVPAEGWRHHAERLTQSVHLGFDSPSTP